MKALLALILVFSLAVAIAPAVLAQDANTDVADTDQMLWSRNPADGPGQIDPGYPVDVAGPGVQWQVNPGTATSGWWDIQLGDNYPVGTQDDPPNAAIPYGFPIVAPGYADLSAYTEFKLAFTNNATTDWVFVNIVLNGGPPGWTWAQSPGQWVPPGETRIETLDLTTVVNRAQTTNISYKLSADYGSGDYEATHFDVTVATFPLDVHVDDDWTSQVDVDAYDASLTWGADAFASVASGVGAVAAGGTVHVHDGTYPEAMQITTPWISVVGTGPATCAIVPSGLAGFNGSGIHVIADHVTLEGFELVGFPTSALPRYGIKLNQAFNTTLQDLEIRDLFRTGVDMLGGGDHAIDGVYCHDNNGNGIQSVDVNGIAYSNITTANNAWGGVGVFTWGRYSPLGTSGIVITGVNSFGETVSDVGGLYLEEGNYNDPPNPEPITWSTNPLDGADVTIQLADFTHFLKGDSDNANLYTRFYATLADAQSAAAGVVSHITTNRYIGEIDGINWYVPANLGGIQAAVNAASADDVVTVDSGIFVEQVDIGQNLTLQGAGLTTIIECPAVLDTSFVTSSVRKAIVCAHDAMDVTVADLTVDGLGLGNANPDFLGIAYRNAGGTISGCDILDVRNTPFSGAQHGLSIYLYNDDLVLRNIEVLDNYLDGFQKTGMALNTGATTPVNVLVSGNTVVGYGGTAITAQNGIQVAGDLITGLIYDNEISGIAYDNSANPIKYVACSILNFYAEVDIEENTIAGAHMGVYNIDGSGTISGNDLTIELVGDFAYGILPTDPPQAVPSPYVVPEAAKPQTGVLGAAGAMALLTVDVTGNTLVFSGPDNTDTYGIEAEAGWGPDDIAITVTDNDVTGFDYGVVFYQATGYDTGLFTSIAANNNDIYGNSSYGMWSNVTHLTVDGTCNWWGHINGPNDPPGNPSAGNGVGGDIVYSPWLDGPGGACTQYGADYVAPDAAGFCISDPTPCVTVPVEFYRTDTTPARGATVTIEVSPELDLCVDVATSIVQGAWLSGYGLGSHFQVTDMGSGIYVVDQAVLGGTASCGPTGGGTLFTLDLTGPVDATGTVTVTAVDVRDCGNPFAYLPGIPGPAATLTVDWTAPAIVADLAAVQEKATNDTDHTTEIDLTWTAPPELDVASVELYRKGFGFYPEYDDDGGSAPAAPADPVAALAAGWTHVVSLVGAASAYTDEPGDRDYWYYVAFVIDDCGNISDVSNRTDGTLNYHLGDVAVSPGDSRVTGVDISALGTAYGEVHGGANYDNEVDVGPTADNSTDGLPDTDNAIQFEDLMIFAINYGTVSKPSPGSVADRNAIALRTERDGSRIEAVVDLSSDGTVQGVSVPLAWNAAAVEPIGFTEGDLVGRQAGTPYLFSPAAGTVDAAVFGSAFAGEGELARITFRIIGSGDPAIALGEVLARDPENLPIDLMVSDARVAPSFTKLLPSAPNPFLGATTISFALAEEGPVRVRIYSVDGRLVRTVVDDVMAAGEKTVQWDGRDDSGRSVASGSYLISLETRAAAESQRVVRLQ